MSKLGNLEWIVLYTTEALRDPSELAEVFQPYLTDNPVFGRLFDLDIHVYFQAEKFHELGRSAVQAKGNGQGQAHRRSRAPWGRACPAAGANLTAASIWTWRGKK